MWHANWGRGGACDHRRGPCATAAATAVASGYLADGTKTKPLRSCGHRSARGTAAPAHVAEGFTEVRLTVFACVALSLTAHFSAWAIRDIAISAVQCRRDAYITFCVWGSRMDLWWCARIGAWDGAVATWMTPRAFTNRLSPWEDGQLLSSPAVQPSKHDGGSTLQGFGR